MNTTDTGSRDRLTRTRVALHAIAEVLVAGPQYAAHGDIRLSVLPDGFAGWVAGGVRVAGTDLITPTGRFPIRGRLGDLAVAAGIESRSLTDVYSGGLTISLGDPVDLDPAATARILGALTVGDGALRELDPRQRPVLWPEHFDVGITLDRVNFGVSPGDGQIAVPYAYVGPWEVPDGDFWNRPFGAARELPVPPDPAGVVEFFRTGQAKLT
jgi:hypothetical protein